MDFRQCVDAPKIAKHFKFLPGVVNNKSRRNFQL